MKSIILFAVCLACFTTFTSAQPVIPKNKIPGDNIGVSPKEVFRNTIDPAVISIGFQTIKRSSGNILRIAGKIKNVGGKNYNSSNGQQIIQLWEISATGRKMVSTQSFVNLRAGQEVTIVYERPALKSSDVNAPDYQVFIVYDPDIDNDGNLNNDDANLSNNTMRKNPRG